MNNKYKAVLWDFDGTIMDTNQLILESWNHTSKTFYGKLFPEEEVLKTYGEPLNPSLARFFPDCNVEEVAAVYRDYQHNHPEKAHVFDGIEDVLKTLKKHNYLLGIVTSRDWSQFSPEAYNFAETEKLFDVIIAKRDTQIHKPNPTPCLMALDRLEIKPEEAVYIGDSSLDVQCANNAGVDSVLVGWSRCCTPDQANELCTPKYIIDKPEDLLDII